MTCSKNDYGCVTTDIGKQFKESLQTFDIIRNFSGWLQLCYPKKSRAELFADQNDGISCLFCCVCCVGLILWYNGLQGEFKKLQR